MLWRILLNYFPLDKYQWESTSIIYKRQFYSDECANYFDMTKSIVQDENKLNDVDLDKLCDFRNSVDNNNTTQDSELVNEILKDVYRTRPDISCFNYDESAKRMLLRILFIFAKLHPDVGYVQGMNEICATLLYVFITDENLYLNKYAEVDCFHCFCSLINLHKGTVFIILYNMLSLLFVIDTFLCND